MDKVRIIKKYWRSQQTMEGAGVRLKRAFGFYEVPELDPFLLLDDFHSDNPKDYIAGFPWHPHRGIETITYMLQGEVNHEDSLGNKGTIRAGEVQWMTAGSGIIHQEMPQPQKDYLAGLQLWANLPKANKMMHPRYREITKDDIIEITINDKVNVKVIAGEVNGTKGPVQDIVISPEYLDVTILPNGEFTHKVNPEHTVFAYILEGNGYFDEQKNVLLEKENLVLFEKGDSVKITSKDKHLRFILISGMPIGESIAWRGPIVMNSDHELKVAFEELQKGIFIKHK